MTDRLSVFFLPETTLKLFVILYIIPTFTTPIIKTYLHDNDRIS